MLLVQVALSPGTQLPVSPVHAPHWHVVGSHACVPHFPQGCTVDGTQRPASLHGPQVQVVGEHVWTWQFPQALSAPGAHNASPAQSPQTEFEQCITPLPQGPQAWFAPSMQLPSVQGPHAHEALHTRCMPGLQKLEPDSIVPGVQPVAPTQPPQNPASEQVRAPVLQFPHGMISPGKHSARGPLASRGTAVASGGGVAAS